LVLIHIDGLLAHQHQVRLLALVDGGEDFGDAGRVEGIVGLHEDRAVCAHRQRGAQLLLCLSAADGHGDHFSRLACLLEAYRFL